MRLRSAVARERRAIVQREAQEELFGAGRISFKSTAGTGRRASEPTFIVRHRACSRATSSIMGREFDMPVSPPLTPGALQGARVLDLSDKSCTYGAKVLADLGADVVRIEPVTGDPMRQMEPIDPVTGESLFYRFMNTNKRSVALDLEQEAGRA